MMGGSFLRLISQVESKCQSSNQYPLAPKNKKAAISHIRCTWSNKMESHLESKTYADFGILFEGQNSCRLFKRQVGKDNFIGTEILLI